LLTGFPWNLAGYGWAFSDWASQSVAWIGIYGLTALTVLAAALPSVLVGGSRGDRRALAAVWLIFAAMVCAGGWRLHGAEAGDVPGVRLRIVQANISQHHKWDPALQMQGMERYMALSVQLGLKDITYVIWPETAVPYVLSENSTLGSILAQAVPPGGVLLTGTMRAEGQDETFRIWNSLVALNDKGAWLAWYDKHKLVPFGEFVPLRSVLPVEKITHGNVDFSAGPGPRTLTAGSAPPFSPLICYEAIFPEAAADAGQRPGWLLNVTNDAWFGISSGPYQHLAMARFRAIEQGVPLVRAANTGISVVTDAYGRVLAELPLGTQGVLDHALPRALGESTLGSAIDKYFLPLILLLGIFTFVYSRRGDFKK
jgi:apolipoprotein N-acyltransferase